MKRSLLMTSLVLGLALAACGGGGGGPDAPAGGDQPPAGGDTSSDDPVAQLQKISDGIQKDVDAILAPINGANDVIDGVTKLSADLKVSMKGKFDPKKFFGEVGKVVNGQDADLASLGLDADAQAKVTTQVQKLKDLVTAVKNIDQAAKDLGGKITDALPKLATLGPKALASVELTLKNPLASADKKKDAQAQKDKITGIIDGFKTKATQWQSDLTGLPAKAKEIPGKLAKLKP
jgi:hypothetical protein